MLNLENWIENKIKLLRSETGNQYTAEIVLKITASGRWSGYVWIFDSDNNKGQRYLTATNHNNIIDVLVQMERICQE